MLIFVNNTESNTISTKFAKGNPQNSSQYDIYHYLSTNFFSLEPFFWQCNPHQSEGMAYAAQLLFPHSADLRCVCWRHQSNQIPHHLSSSKCIPFSFVPLSKLFKKLIVNVYSGVSNQATGCSMWMYNNPALCVFHASAAYTVWSLF